MAHPARILAAALLVTALAVPASLQASGQPSLRPAARFDAGSSFSADSWSFDWLFRFINQLWPKTGPGLYPSGGTGSSTDTGLGLDPSGRASLHRRAADSYPDAGGGLDPNGRASLHRRAADSYPDAGGGLDPNGRANSRFSSGGRHP
jgi:hypothetical protein